MRPTLLQYGAAWAQLLPPLVAVAAGRLATPARRWIVIWCLLLVAQDAINLTLALQGVNNLWVGYTFRPLTSSVALWGLAHWHRGATGRHAVRLAIPLVIVVSALLTLRFEDQRSFSLFVAPFHAVVLLLASLWTFIQASLSGEERFTRGDWFWVAGGLMLYFAASAALQPLSWYFLADRVDLLHAAMNVKAGADVLAFVAITGGMLCPILQTPSGGSSSSPSSPLSCSSEDWGQRW